MSVHKFVIDAVGQGVEEGAVVGCVSGWYPPTGQDDLDDFLHENNAEFVVEVFLLISTSAIITSTNLVVEASGDWTPLREWGSQGWGFAGGRPHTEDVSDNIKMTPQAFRITASTSNIGGVAKSITQLDLLFGNNEAEDCTIQISVLNYPMTSE